MRDSTLAARRSWVAVLCLGLVVAGLRTVGWADPVAPTGRDQQIAVVVAELLQKRHLSRHPFDQEIAERAITQFLKMLDPMKLYFYRGDVDALMARHKEVQNVVRRGDVGFAYAAFRIFLSRVDQRLQLAEQLLSVRHDFTVDEEMITDPDQTDFPRDEAEAREKWRKRIKYDLLDLKADRLEEERTARKAQAPGQQPPAEPRRELSPEQQYREDVERLRTRYQSIARRWHQVDGDELLELYLSAISTSFDPHTTYMSPSTVDNFEIQMKLKLEGIGAALRSADGYTVVDRIVPGGPAESDGRLKVGDKIVGVGEGPTGTIEDVTQMKLTDVVKRIRGPKGTVVRLKVIPKDSAERKIIELTRAEVQLKDAEARSAIFEAGRRPDGRPYRIGVIDLPSFYMDMAGARQGIPDFKSTTRDVREILESFNRQGIDAVLLDLRRNGGGSLQEAIDVTGLFVGQGPVVQVKGLDGRTHHYNEEKNGMVWKGPLVVLISKYSASASEILAGAVQDYRRGLVIGDRSTHGKGTVQSLLDLSEAVLDIPFAAKLGALKLTIQKYYRPCGDSTQLRGVLSDIELPSITTHRDIGEADLDYPLPFDQVSPMQYIPFDYLNKQLIEQLNRLSAERRSQSDEFQKLSARIARYQEKKKHKRVTLNEKKFLEEWAELSAQREEEKEMEEMIDPGKTEIKRDFYLNEALAITADYLARWPGKDKAVGSL